MSTWRQVFYVQVQVQVHTPQVRVQVPQSCTRVQVHVPSTESHWFDADSLLLLPLAVGLTGLQ